VAQALVYELPVLRNNVSSKMIFLICNDLNIGQMANILLSLLNLFS